MMTLDPAGLEAAAKALSHDEGIALWDEWTPAAQSDLLTAAEAAIRAYLTAAGRAAAPDDDDGPFREDLPAILQSVRDGQGTGHYEHPVVPLHIALAAVTRAEAAGRAAATPDLPKDERRPWPIAPDTVMPSRRQPVRWGSRADDPPTEIHDDPEKTKAYLAGLAAGRTEAAAASPDERLREVLREIVRQVEKYPALSPTGIMVRDDIAGMVEGTARAALAASPDERLREADRRVILEWAKFTRDEAAGYWGRREEDVYQRLLAAADREKPDGPKEKP